MAPDPLVQELMDAQSELGRHDPGWPLGSLASHPFVVRDGLLRGAGCLDVEAGVAMAIWAAGGQPAGAPITVLITGDEQIGSPSSRTLIEQEARLCQAVLAAEASGDDGAAEVERKGASMYELKAIGRAAHAIDSRAKPLAEQAHNDDEQVRVAGLPGRPVLPSGLPADLLAEPARSA
jgi:L-alanine-DL-glutamate epimerase-like enolase superfamily enzyme